MSECRRCKEKFSGFWSAFSPERWSATTVRSGWENDFARIKSCKSRLFYLTADSFLCTKCMANDNTMLESKIKEATKSFIGVFRHDLPARYGKWTEIGWIKLTKLDSPAEYERELKRLAIMAAGCAAIKSYWSKNVESYVAGHGAKGNPYYRTHTTYSGEALVVGIK